MDAEMNWENVTQDKFNYWTYFDFSIHEETKKAAQHVNIHLFLKKNNSSKIDFFQEHDSTVQAENI